MSQTVFSIGMIAKRTGRPLHQVRYAIESRGISSIGRVGGANLYTQDAVRQIEAVFAERDQRVEEGQQVRPASVPA
jgi:hypothetical protein